MIHCSYSHSLTGYSPTLLLSYWYFFTIIIIIRHINTVRLLQNNYLVTYEKNVFNIDMFRKQRILHLWQSPFCYSSFSTIVLLTRKTDVKN